MGNVSYNIYLNRLNAHTDITKKMIQLDPKELKQWTTNDRPTIIYAMPPKNWLGDSEVTIRLLLTAKEMGWNIISQADAKNIPRDQLQNAFGIYINDILEKKAIEEIRRSFPNNLPLFEIDWRPKREDTQNPLTYAFKKQPLNTRIYAILAPSYYPIDMEIPQNNKISNLKFMMTWYPTVKATYYQPQPSMLMYAGTKNPNDVRSQYKKYTELWKKLDNQEYFVVYGHQHAWKGYRSYQGYIPADGKSFVQTINKNGICLILHNDTHLTSGVPTGRIFEAAAAAAIIISDKHSFVEREFKDSVLYIDQTRDDMFEQIEAHMRWIKENPEEAKKKARLAHAIFLEKFTLEQQLARLYKNIDTMKNKSP